MKYASSHLQAIRFDRLVEKYNRQRGARPRLIRFAFLARRLAPRTCMCETLTSAVFGQMKRARDKRSLGEILESGARNSSAAFSALRPSARRNVSIFAIRRSAHNVGNNHTIHSEPKSEQHNFQSHRRRLPSRVNIFSGDFSPILISILVENVKIIFLPHRAPSRSVSISLAAS